MYACLPADHFEEGAYALTPLREQDLLYIKEWRNTQIDVLRQNKLLTDDDQINYYNKVIKPSYTEEQPRLILFSYLMDGVCIGYGGLTNIDWSSLRAEVSFLLETTRIVDKVQYKRDFSMFLTLLKKVAFQSLAFNRLFTETYDIRPDHITALEKSGFRYEGRMKQHVQVQGAITDSIIHGCLKEYGENDW
ncbi:hypothetical protein ASG89_29015 [Paenibacillus sp. Soil766]|uniref:GNAT family N-acetyltransferase n=1 Tax=Paenibacillus sp. Soil766 TaxID=1736404 RepID=UPI0007097300|nr:GNAT family N-acetyltransferase [Paenibacillus sp. Soil766]KRE97946.1 hypothetical protein ASG89_29015 [Paenibacillus sp. Soil766]